MRDYAILPLTLTALAFPDVAAASQLVFGLDHDVAGSRAPMAAPQGLQFVIEFVSPVEPPPGLALVGREAYWQDGASGSYDFSVDSSGEAAALASLVTNGYDDEIGLLTYNEFYGSQGSAALESQWGFGNPDLAGNQIDFIRLVVHDLTIQPYDDGPPFGEGLEWNGHITWEFWGTPVPEPASAMLLFLTATLLLRRGRASRHLTGGD